MKKFLLYFPMFSLLTPVLKANTGSFLEPLRQEFPEFVQKAETETPLFIRYMDAKSLTNFQYFKGIALDTVAFSTIQFLIDSIIPNYFSIKKMRFKYFLDTAEENLFFLLAREMLTYFSINSKKIRILDFKKKDLILFYLKNYAFLFATVSILDGTLCKDKDTSEELLPFFLYISCPIYYLNYLKEAKLKKEKEVFLKDLSQLMEDNPSSTILREILLKVSL